MDQLQLVDAAGSILDGQTHYPSYVWGTGVTTSSPQVGATSGRVLYELTGTPVSASSIYEIQFAQRAKLLP